MKDKRTYINKKEHGEDMTHENESKIDTTPIQLLTEQYKTELHKYREREGMYIKTQNQLDATKTIVMEMSGTIRQLHTENENLKAEVSRLLEEIQLLEMKIKK
jgi:predicted RNase H-like nuclease (RuvC/YqgF family)